LKNTFTPLEDFRDNDLKRNGIEELKDIKMEFESGVVIEGRLVRVIRKTGKIILMSFDNCTVRYQDKVLFEPGWGVYDMAVGSEIISGFSGPADPNAFGLSYEAPKEKTHKIVHSD
jgi:phenylalanine-4-hydroxylase